MTPPFAIYASAGQYLVFDIATVRRLRSELRVCGIVVGTLPQISQQSIFLGLPLLLQEEEATYLVERGHAFIVDDARRHDAYTQVAPEDVAARNEARQKIALDRALEAGREQKERRIATLREKGLHEVAERVANETKVTDVATRIDTVSDFKDEPVIDTRRSTPRYRLFEFLHDRGYFMTPGLRFGGDFVAYPGDPLRYHSHFTCKAKAADEQWPVMDLVSGGRLGTGVKKSWLVGSGEQCFTIEWAGL